MRATLSFAAAPAAILASIAVAACAASVLSRTGRAQSSATICNDARVIVGFMEPFDDAPDESFVTGLARSADVQLELVGSIAPDLHVFMLSARDDCGSAMQRLRNDSRVRSVDMDTLRTPHAPST